MRYSCCLKQCPIPWTSHNFLTYVLQVIITYGIKYFYIFIYEHISKWVSLEKYVLRTETHDQNETELTLILQSFYFYFIIFFDFKVFKKIQSKWLYWKGAYDVSGKNLLLGLPSLSIAWHFICKLGEVSFKLNLLSKSRLLCINIIAIFRIYWTKQNFYVNSFKGLEALSSNILIHVSIATGLDDGSCHACEGLERGWWVTFYFSSSQVMILVWKEKNVQERVWRCAFWLVVQGELVVLHSALWVPGP